MSVADYNTDPNSNTSISGINIAEGCPPSGINNAIRQMMADIKTADNANVKQAGAQNLSGVKTWNVTNAGPRCTNNGGTLTVGMNVSDTPNGGIADVTNGTWIVARNPTGGFFMQANSGGNSCVFEGAADGTLQWGGKDIITNGGDQTVGGVKTFTSEPLIKKSGTFMRFRNTSLTKGTIPGSSLNYWLPFEDKDGNAVGVVECVVQNAADATCNTRLYSYANTSSAISCYVAVGANKDSYKYFRPNSNGEMYLGTGGLRWGQIYSSNSTISTSDERLKQQVASIPNAVLDAWGDVDWRQFKFNSSVEEKGNAARIHTGLIAQHIDEVFRRRNLDASRYGLWCFDAWDATPEEVDDNGNVRNAEQPAGDMYSIRYEEALAMEAAYQRRRADRAEARIAALEQRLDEMEAVLATLGG